jgi:sugar O-acyltransferase (sialic acid O-acetyltransferase NeuD family)
MSNKVILFGIREIAEIAHYYLSIDSDYEVVAFTVHEAYKEKEEFKGLPVISFESIKDKFPPDEYRLFAPMYCREMNKLREKVYKEGKRKGYSFISYISSKAIIENCTIGENCMIGAYNVMHPFCSIGNNVISFGGNLIGHHAVIKDHVFIVGNVTVGGHSIIESRCFLGISATIKPGSHLSKGTLLGMSSSLIAEETEDWGIYAGNPARKRGNKPSYEVL